MKGYEIKFNIYANDEKEVEEARRAIVEFIDDHARHGRAVTAKKIATAIPRWKDHLIIRNKVIAYFE